MAFIRHCGSWHKRLLALSMLVCFYLAIPNQLYAQQNVSGTVTDDTGAELPGVTVLIKGSAKGTTTDMSGNYSIEVESGQTLSYSFIGFKTQEVKVGNQSKIDISLSTDIEQLSEVVVVGYGTQKKSDVTGAITTVNAKAITEVPAPNVTQALQGRIAGVQLQRTSSRPGAEMRIRIRGNRSLGGNSANEPLVVLDGIPYLGGLNSINQGDIKSINILKDASSTAIYGSRGANGVILITTKRGRAGESNVSYNGYHGISQPLGNYDVFNGEEYAKFVQDAGQYELTADERESIDLARSVDWQDLMLKQGIITNHELSFTGGTDKTQFLFSGNYFKETNALPGQSFNRNSMRLTLDHQVNDRIKLGISSQLSYNVSLGESQNPYFNILTMSPLFKPYTEDGEVNRLPAIGHIDDNRVNPLLLYNSDLWVSERRQMRAFNSFYGEVKILDGLKYRINVGLDGSFTKRGNFTSAILRSNQPNTANSLNNHGYNYTIENLLVYDKVFAQKHSLNLTGLFSVQKDKFTQESFGTNSIVNDQLQFYDFSQSGTTVADSPTYSEWGIISYMARANYAYDNRYLLTLTGRVDGSSRLAKGSQYFVYPAVALGWNIKNESFMGGVTPVSELKLRAGYGLTSNQAIAPYASLGSLGERLYNIGPDGGVIGYEVSNLANNNLSWEFTKTANIGVDFGFLTNRIKGSIEVYQQDTEDILQSQDLPIMSGVAGSYRVNIGQTRNRGIELAMNALIVEPKSPGDFSFEVDVNFTSWQEEITQLVDTLKRNISNGWFVGEPMDVIYDYRKIGIWQSDEADEASTFDGRVPGDIKVEDVNGNGIRDDEDRTIIGKLNPDWIGGITTRFGYKGFDLSVVAFARVGGMTISRFHQGNVSFPIATMEGRRNQADVDYWTPDNPTNAYPRPGLQSPQYGSTLGYFNATFAKIRSINLGYTLPPVVLDKVGLKAARVYVTANNPFKAFFSDLVKAGAVDPEPNGTGSTSTSGFGDSSQRLVVTPDSPIMKSFIFGINVQF